jgi:hypothetical protein
VPYSMYLVERFHTPIEASQQREHKWKIKIIGKLKSEFKGRKDYVNFTEASIREEVRDTVLNSWMSRVFFIKFFINWLSSVFFLLIKWGVLEKSCFIFENYFNSRFMDDEPYFNSCF